MRTQVCVVGGGAAGITLAQELAKNRIPTLLLESGGLELEHATQALYKGDVVGSLYGSEYLTATRLRQLGGSTHHWARKIIPLSPVDFLARAWVPNSGWPISLADLEPYYTRAESVLGVEPQELPTHPRMGDAGLQSLSIRRAPARFAQHSEGLQKSDTTDIYIYGNVVELVGDKAESRLSRVEVRTLSGTRFAVEARAYVLATGAIENSRLLLSSNSAMEHLPATAAANVGKYFMPHLVMRQGPAMVVTPLRGPMGFSEALQQRYGLLNSIMNLQPLDTQSRGASVSLGAALGSTIRQVDGVRRQALLGVKFGSETVPARDNAVTLGRSRDALGMRRVHLQWTAQALDIESIGATLQLLGHQLGEFRLGRASYDSAATGLSRLAQGGSVVGKRGELLWHGFHHMGTTRMSASPEHGVVDRDCRTYGLRNLFIAGSSVFPTSGAAAPTFTIVALALRIADQLKSKLA